MSTLLLVGLSHRSAPLAVLEKVAVPEDDRPGLLSELLTSPAVTEALLVSTCNRVEVCAVVRDRRDAVPHVLDVLARHAGLPAAELDRHGYVHRDDDAVRHLFEVAAGLDSLVVGDGQILGQVRSAYAASTAHGASGPVLHPLVQQALRVGKEVAARTDLSDLGASVVTAALQHVTAVLPPTGLTGRRALVLGAGALGALAVAHLQRVGVREVVVVNRTPSRASELAARSGSAAVRAVPADDLVDALGGTDVVLACSASATAMISVAQVEDAVTRRGEGCPPLVLCDLGLPRNVEPGAAGIAGVVLLDLEALRPDGRTSAGSDRDVVAARTIVADRLTAYRARRRAAAARPAVATPHHEQAPRRDQTHRLSLAG